MIKTNVSVVGMACSMCEAHINDAVRNAFDIKKVTSSHSKGETVIISDLPLDEEKLKEVIKSVGYEVGPIFTSPHEKKSGLFAKFKK